VKSGATDPETVALVRHADDRWGKYAGRSDQDRRVMEIVERAREEHPFGDSELTFDGINLGEQQVFNLTELMALEVHFEFLIKEMMSMGDIGFIAGPPGVGKTTLGLRLAESLAGARSFLDRDGPDHPQKVLFLSLEMNAVGLKRFLETMENYGHDCDPTNLLILPGSAMNLSRPEGRQALQALLDRHKPDVLFIDSLGKIAGGKLSDDDIARDLMNYLDSLCKTQELSIYLVHHSRKSNERNKHPDTLDDLYGSQYFAASVGWVWTLTKEDEQRGLIRLTQTKQRYSAWQAPLILRRTPRMDFETEGDSGVDYGGPAGGGSGASPKSFDGWTETAGS